MELPPPGELDLVVAETVTETLLHHWTCGAERMVSPATREDPSRAHLVDLCAWWMLRLHAEVRTARHQRRSARSRARQIRRLLDCMQRGLQPRLCRALDGCLRGHVFLLRLRRSRSGAMLFHTWRVEIE